MLGPVLAWASELLSARGPWRAVRQATQRRPWQLDRLSVTCGLLAATLWASAGLRWGWSVTTLAYSTMFGVLVVVAVIDTVQSRIPDRITFPATTVATVVVFVATCWSGRFDRLAAAAVGGLAMWGGLGAAHLVSPRGLGRGDVKLGAVLGIGIGWAAATTSAAVRASLFAFLLASLIGTAVGLVLLVRRGRSEPYPFGPALIAGSVMVMLGFGSAPFG